MKESFDMTFQTLKLDKCDFASLHSATKAAIEKAYYGGEQYGSYHTGK
jgi:hypothetical protein